MLIKKVVLTTLFCAAMVVPTFSQGNQGGAPQEGAKSGDVKLDVVPFFDSVDTGKDNKITKEEWVAAGLDEGIYKFFDMEGVGFFTKEALAAMSHPAAIDADKDGKMTLPEVKAFTESLPKPDGSEGAAQ